MEALIIATFALVFAAAVLTLLGAVLYAEVSCLRSDREIAWQYHLATVSLTPVPVPASTQLLAIIRDALRDDMFAPIASTEFAYSELLGAEILESLAA